jgi:ribosomal protein S27AE
MGCFDVVRLPCPRCGSEVDFQTKYGPCNLRLYRPGNVPPDVAGGVHGEGRDCPGCGSTVYAVVQLLIMSSLSPAGEPPSGDSLYDDDGHYIEPRLTQ